jgi:hypothetical protein
LDGFGIVAQRIRGWSTAEWISSTSQPPPTNQLSYSELLPFAVDPILNGKEIALFPKFG